MSRQLHLAVNYNPGLGMHPARWRVVEDPHQFYDIRTYIEIAKIAEDAKFDAIFISDVPTLLDDPPVVPWHVLEPTVALGALAVETTHIGLVGTASTSFNHPYNIARRFASLDHMSDGRVAWNIVASYRDWAAANYGAEIADHEARYARAEEFVDVALQLWDSWEEGALVADQQSGQFADGSKVHRIDHRGDYFAVRGPHQVPRSPQGRPVLVQAGASEQGADFAARHADLVFTMLPTLEGARQNYAATKERIARQGRRPEEVFLMASVYPVVGRTESDARRQRARLDALIDFEQEITTLSGQLRIELSTADLDLPVPQRPDSQAYYSGESLGLNEHVWQALATHQGLTLREFLLLDTRRSRPLVGSPEQIADELESWFRGGAADGFNVSFTHFPEGLERFVEYVIPVLRRRGLFREEYEGSTFRDHFGIPVPGNRHSTVTA
jgi:FMN-dependent oxidoreductase (nitrilotriacetate monooxygenase family)